MSSSSRAAKTRDIQVALLQEHEAGPVWCLYRVGVDSVANGKRGVPIQDKVRAGTWERFVVERPINLVLLADDTLNNTAHHRKTRQQHHRAECFMNY